MISEHTLGVIETTVHGRYLVRPATTGGERSGLVVGFHGYGESAEDHLAELERIPGISTWSVVAVQALHPFYNSRSGNVVASWMTRLDRELAIADNTRYVAKVLERELARCGGLSRLVWVGFSQGTAMAYRAAAGSGHRGHGLVALGGDVPPELSTRDLTGFPPVLIGRGIQDEWYTEDKLARDRELLSLKGIACERVQFEGGHEWTAAFRESVGVFLRRILSS